MQAIKAKYMGIKSVPSGSAIPPGGVNVPLSSLSTDLTPTSEVSNGDVPVFVSNAPSPYAPKPTIQAVYNTRKSLNPQEFNPGQNLSDSSGRRVRLRPKPNAAADIYGTYDGILSPLYNTRGMVFPYQPLVTYQQDVQYSEMELIHTNQEIQAYKRTPALKLSVDGEFTVQNQTEGLYALACIQFMRVVSKMYFGDSDKNAGTPPPVLLFDAYGAYMFNSLPVIVTQFSVTLPKDVDYIPVDVTQYDQIAFEFGDYNCLTNEYLRVDSAQQMAWIPSLFNIQIQLVVQNTPQRLRAFNLDQFRSGQLIQQGGWI